MEQIGAPALVNRSALWRAVGFPKVCLLIQPGTIYLDFRTQQILPLTISNFSTLANFIAKSYLCRMIFRKLTADDAAAFRELRMEMCSKHPEAFGQTPEEVAAAPDEKLVEWINPSDKYPEKFIMAYFENNRLVGTAAFHRQDSYKEKHRGWIWSVYVRPEARGKGISRQLMEYLIAEAHKMDGLEILALTVSVTQTEARTLYTSLGFVTTGLNRQGYKLADGRYIDHEEMSLWL